MFQSIPSEINRFETGWSKNLIMETCEKVKHWRLTSSVIVLTSCQLYWVIESKHNTSEGLVNVVWVVLHRRQHIGASERRQLIPHVRFQVPGPFGARKSIEIRLRMCGPPLFQIYACLNKCRCNFLSVARVGLCCWFCDFAVSFLVPQDAPRNGIVKMIFFCSFSKPRMRSQNWDRLAVPFLGPCLGSFFFLHQAWRSAMFWFQVKHFGLWRAERQLGRPFWAKPALRKVVRTRLGSAVL